MTAVERRHAARAPCRRCVGGVVEPELQMERVHGSCGWVQAHILERRLVVNDRSGSYPRATMNVSLLNRPTNLPTPRPSSLVTTSP